MATLVTIYGNICMGGRERSSEDHVIGVVFDEESHGNIRFYSFGRRYTALKQTPRMPWHPPVVQLQGPPPPPPHRHTTPSTLADSVHTQLVCGRHTGVAVGRSPRVVSLGLTSDEVVTFKVATDLGVPEWFGSTVHVPRVGPESLGATFSVYDLFW